MANDIFQSKRNYNQLCKWWSCTDEDRNTLDELILKRVPTGIFYAKEVSQQDSSSSVLSNTFMFERNQVTIKTPDNIYGIKKNDLVEYEGERWIVELVQKPHSRLQHTFFANDKHCSHFYYIELRK